MQRITLEQNKAEGGTADALNACQTDAKLCGIEAGLQQRPMITNGLKAEPHRALAVCPGQQAPFQWPQVREGGRLLHELVPQLRRCLGALRPWLQSRVGLNIPSPCCVS